MISRRDLFATLPIALCVSACIGPADTRDGTASRAEREAVYARTELAFSAANFFKPRRQGSSEGDVYQAPLLIQEVLDGSVEALRVDRFGAVETAVDGRPRLDTEKPTLYTGKTTTFLNGREYLQVTYLWHYAPAGEDSTPARPAVQGLRITRDHSGYPAIVEVLADTTGLRILYVARRLEDAAASEFGEALAGRHFSVERRLPLKPRVVVAGVFDDGPEPMGPVVYLMAGSHDVSSLGCRCMPSRVEAIRENEEYELLPVPELDGAGTGGRLPSLARELSWRSPMTHTGSERESTGWLQSALRIPRDF